MTPRNGFGRAQLSAAVLTGAAVVLCGAAWATPLSAKLSLRVIGAEPLRGQVLAALYASEEAFMNEPLAELQAPVGADGTAALEFGVLAPGEYAISVVHDANGNGELDRGWFGIPREPVGFSNDAPMRFGPPAWSEARFSLESSVPRRLEIALVSVR